LRGHDERQSAEQRRARDGRPRGLGGRRHALAHDGFDRRGRLRLLLLESAKLRAEEDEHLRFRARGDGRRPPTAVEHGDLAEEVAGPERPHDLTGDRHLCAAVGQDEEAVAGGALSAEPGTGPDGAILEPAGERAALVLGEAREQRDGSQLLRIDGHRANVTPACTSVTFRFRIATMHV